MIWTLGNLLTLIGIVLIAYVGGLYSYDEYQRYAARGDTDAPAPRAAAPAVAVPAVEAPLPFLAPILNVGSSDEGRVTGSIPVIASENPSTVSRIVIPSIGVDTKVIEVGWDIIEQNGSQVAVWQVAEYAVGHHRGSANPGEASNIVLAGHVGGYGKVFKDLIDVQPGDRLTIYSGDQQYLYTVQEQLILLEEGVSDEQRAANAQYIQPTDSETVTLITCWPASGPERFQYRIIVRAAPFGAGDQQAPTISSSTLR
jgi:LPXTG-site transpeptidase (sortase) family protein